MAEPLTVHNYVQIGIDEYNAAHQHTLPNPCGVEEALRIRQRDDAQAAGVANVADYDKAITSAKGV